MPAWLIFILVLLFLVSAGENAPREAGQNTQQGETESQSAEEKRTDIINDCKVNAQDKSRCDDMLRSTEIKVERE